MSCAALRAGERLWDAGGVTSFVFGGVGWLTTYMAPLPVRRPVPTVLELELVLELGFSPLDDNDSRMVPWQQHVWYAPQTTGGPLGFSLSAWTATGRPGNASGRCGPRVEATSLALAPAGFAAVIPTALAQ